MNKKQEIVKKFRSAESNIGDMAREFGVSRQYVQQILSAEVPNYKEKLTRIRKKKARNHFLEARKEKQDKTTAKFERVKKISALWIAGKPAAEIAPEFGFKLNSFNVWVSQRRKKYPALFPLRK